MASPFSSLSILSPRIAPRSYISPHDDAARPSSPPAQFQLTDYIDVHRPYRREEFPSISGIDSEPALRFAASKIFVASPDSFEVIEDSELTDEPETAVLCWQTSKAFGEFAATFEQLATFGLSHHHLFWQEENDFSQLFATSPRIISLVGQLQYGSQFLRMQEDALGAMEDAPLDLPSRQQVEIDLDDAFHQLLQSYNEVALAGAQLAEYTQALARLNLGESIENIRETNQSVDFDPMDPAQRDLMGQVASISNQWVGSPQYLRTQSTLPLQHHWWEWLTVKRTEQEERWRRCLLLVR